MKKILLLLVIIFLSHPFLRAQQWRFVGLEGRSIEPAKTSLIKDGLCTFLSSHDSNNKRDGKQSGKDERFRVSINSGSVIDSVIVTNFDGLKFKYTYTYDLNGKLISILSEIFKEINWENLSRWSYIYDSNGNKIAELSENWDGSLWVNSRQYAYTYDPNENIISSLSKRWVVNNWVNYYRYTYVYNSNKEILFHLIERWEGSSWINIHGYSYSFDSNGNIASEIFQEGVGSELINNTRYIFSYDSSQNLILKTEGNWDGSMWQNYYRYSFTYDQNWNKVFSLTEAWDGSDWIRKGRYVYSYDLNGSLTIELYEKWLASQWINYFRTTFTYDSNGSLTFGLSSYWDEGEWKPNQRNFNLSDSYDRTYSYQGVEINIFYSTSTNIRTNNTLNLNYSLTQNYPNPFDGQTTIRYFIPWQCQVQLKIFDILGRDIKTLVNQEQQAGSYEVGFNMTGIPNGIYFYKLHAGRFIQTRKMILQ
ncbi:MAG: T9SS type A sorting domain-containing protein [Deferribacteres bacterium]|nr:T9SS type A sorting domain-containing protein [Deferribacteres bacterium]